MTEISSLPLVQKEPQLEDILDSLWSGGNMSEDLNPGPVDNLYGNNTSEGFLDFLVTNIDCCPTHPVQCGHEQTAPVQNGCVQLGGDYLGLSPSSSDGYGTDQPSPFSESNASETTSSCQGNSPISFVPDDVLKDILDHPSSVSPSGTFPVTSVTATLGETTSSPQLVDLGQFDDFNFAGTQGQELDLDLLEMTAETGNSPQPSTRDTTLQSCPAERKASLMKISSEERAMLEAEGIYLPEDMPLTKAEEKHLRKVRRKLKNRQSAHESRQRKKEYVDGLEERVEKCTSDNRMLQKKVFTLEEQNKSLLSQLRRLQKVVKAYNPGAFQTGCVMVMVLSFSLFFIPKFLSNGVGTGLGDTAIATGAIAVGVRSRALLDTPTEFGFANDEQFKDSKDTPLDSPPSYLHHAFKNPQEVNDQEVLPSQEVDSEVVVEEKKGHNLEDL